MEKILFIGMGAIGASFAAQMKDKGVTPVVLCDEKRKARYVKDGFIVNGKRYDYEYLLPKETHYKADLLFVAVKYHHLTETINQIKNFVGPETIIVSLMNGIDSELILSEAFGKNHVVPAFVMGIDAVREDNSINYQDPGKITFGNKNGLEDSKTEFIQHLFKKTAINYELSDEILKKQWWKFMVNVSINQVSAILDAPYGVFDHYPVAFEILELAMKEVIELSKAMNVNLDETAISQFKGALHNLTETAVTSMVQDVRAKRKTEVEMLSGQVISFGKKYGIKTPVNELLFKMIQTIEYMNNVQ
ncbi:MAG: ketopantoate reductase family protein [Clostridiales bacterium]|nr:ketopantoate reductase family protein [Clostridiales bacterium]